MWTNNNTNKYTNTKLKIYNITIWWSLFYWFNGTGAVARDIEWEADIGDAPFGQPSPLTIDANVLFDPDSPDVAGDGLWQLGVFAAKMPDGTGPRRDEVTQTLDPYNQALPLEEGGPLDFGSIDVPFPIDELGCDEYRWLCIEFKRGEAPNPDFGFTTESGEDSLISCKEQKCRGNIEKPFIV